MFIDWIIAVAKSSMGGLAFYILMGIVILFIISVIVTNRDKIHTIIIVTIGVFYLFSKIYCGPSLIDIYRMKPMAEKIADYIVKNGIPESLEDILGLPYELECDSSGKECYFKNGEYEVRFYKPSYGGYELELSAKSSKTYYKDYFKLTKNSKFILNKDDSGSYSLKNTGICNPMRQ